MDAFDRYGCRFGFTGVPFQRTVMFYSKILSFSVPRKRVTLFSFVGTDRGCHLRLSTSHNT